MNNLDVYGRVYSLVIGRPERVDYVMSSIFLKQKSVEFNGVIPSVVYSPTFNDIVTQSNNPISIDRSVVPPIFKEWTDIQFTAEGGNEASEKSISSDTCKFQLWNLSPEDQEYIEKGMTVILRAGYVQDLGQQFQQTLPELLTERQGSTERSLGSRVLPLLFIGDIVHVKTEKNAEDTITTIRCTDSAFSFKNTRVSYNYQPGTTYKDILKDLIKKAEMFGMNLGEIYYAENLLDPNSVGTTSSTAPNLFSNLYSRPSVMLMDTQLPNGYSVYGGLLESIQNLCGMIGYKAYVTLGKLYVEPRSIPATKPIIELKDESNLFSIKVDDEADEMEGATVRVGGLEIAMPLDARLSKNFKLRIVEGKYKGVRDIESITFKLDYEGSEWDTIITCVSKE